MTLASCSYRTGHHGGRRTAATYQSSHLPMGVSTRPVGVTNVEQDRALLNWSAGIAEKGSSPLKGVLLGIALLGRALLTIECRHPSLEGCDVEYVSLPCRWTK